MWKRADVDDTAIGEDLATNAKSGLHLRVKNLLQNQRTEASVRGPRL